MNKSLFKHTTQLRVRNYEVDWQGVVHNGNYLLYFEVGRIEYLKHLGIKLDINTIQGNSKVVLARNEINYRSSARFDDLLTIYTRISYIHDTSFAFEGFMEESKTGNLIAENIAIHVWLHPISGAPITVNNEFRNTVRQYEGESVAILGPTIAT